MAGGKGTNKSRSLESRAHLTAVQARLEARPAVRLAVTTVESLRSRTRPRRVSRCVSSRSHHRHRGSTGGGGRRARRKAHSCAKSYSATPAVYSATAPASAPPTNCGSYASIGLELTHLPHLVSMRSCQAFLEVADTEQDARRR